MNAVFTKYHLRGLPFDAVLHHFSAKDQHEHIHDHPFSFTTHILKGSYVERVYELYKDGSYRSEVYHRTEGSAHIVRAHTIHEIIDLPEGECFTIIRPQHWEKDTYFFRFEDGKAFVRRWNLRKFREVSQFHEAYGLHVLDKDEE